MIFQKKMQIILKAYYFNQIFQLNNLFQNYELLPYIYINSFFSINLIYK